MNSTSEHPGDIVAIFGPMFEERERETVLFTVSVRPGKLLFRIRSTTGFGRLPGYISAPRAEKKPRSILLGLCALIRAFAELVLPKNLIWM